MQVLQYAKPLPVRKETVDVPELGGAVVVRGLMASEAFAVQAIRSQALRRLREEALHKAAAAQVSPEPSAGPDDAPAPAAVADSQPQLSFDEFCAYGRYVCHLLACAVTVAGGGPLWSADQWESFGQHHPAAMTRLQAVAERLSGLVVEDVEKN